MKHQTKPTFISPVSANLKTPTDLGDKARTAVTNILNPLIADAFALYVKTKNFHWHLSGSHFREYHLMFDEQADQIFKAIDVLAERVRRLGGTTIHSISDISRLQTIKDDNDIYVAPYKMVQRLMEDNKSFTHNLREAHKICDDFSDVATASLLEVFIDESEQRIWFLFETQVQPK